MLRRSPPLLPLVLTAVVLIGCGSHQGAVVTDVTSSGPTGHSFPGPTRHPSPTTAPVGSGPLADFPLDLGYPDENGDDGTPVAITTEPATTRFAVCHRVVWDPRHGTTGVIGVVTRGEAEYARGRTLVVYPDAVAATAAVDATRDAVAFCPDEPDGRGQGTTHTVIDESQGEQSLVWTDTFYSVHDGEEQHDTGLVVYEVARVGRAVLLAYEYGEGNGSPHVRAQAIARTLRGERPVVDRMNEKWGASS